VERVKIYGFLHVSDVKNLNTSVLDFCVVSVIWSVRVHGCLYGF